MAETLSTRVTRLENAMAEMAEKVNILIDAQIKTEARFQEMGMRFQETGERIDKLVSAVGELIRRQDGKQGGN
jgi:hypothetical protein